MKRYLHRLPFLLCGIVAFVLGMKQLREPDIWWQLLAGRWMLGHGQVTHTDVFSYTMAGHNWVNVKWLYEIIIATLEKGLGPEGVLLLQSIVSVLIIFLAVRTMKKLCIVLQRPLPYFFTVLSLLVFLMVVEYRMAGRPEMISHLLCALYLYILLSKPAHEWKQILWLVPLQCLWANMHEGYPVGLVMCAAFAAGTFLAYLLDKNKATLQQAIRLGVVFVAMVGAVLINPNGVQLLKQPFEIYRQVWANKYTTELYAWYEPDYWTVQAKLYAAMLLVVGLYWGGKLFKERKNIRESVFAQPVVAAYMLLMILFAYLSLTANRNIPFAAIVLLPSLPLVLYDAAHRRVPATAKWYALLQRNTTLIGTLLAFAFFVSIVNNSYYKATGSVNRYGIHISLLHNPIGAAAYLKEHNIVGPAFSDYFASSYLLWSNYPQFKSYIDLRDLDVFSTAFFSDYFDIYNKPALFNDLDKQYNFNYVVVSTSQLVQLQMNLYWRPGYNMVYVDPVATIFLKSNEQNKPINNNPAFQKPFSWPQSPEDPSWASVLTHLFNPAVSYSEEDETRAPIYAALFYNQMRDYPQAINILLPQMGTLQDDPLARKTISDIYMNYANVTKDMLLKQKRIDSANSFAGQ